MQTCFLVMWFWNFKIFGAFPGSIFFHLIFIIILKFAMVRYTQKIRQYSHFKIIFMIILVWVRQVLIVHSFVICISNTSKLATCRIAASLQFLYPARCRLAPLLYGFGDNYHPASLSFEIIRFSENFRGQILFFM